MDNLDVLIEQHIEEQYMATIKAVTVNPEFQADVKEMNRLFEVSVKSYHDSRRYAYLFIARVQEQFYKKGFWAGMEFALDAEGEQE